MTLLRTLFVASVALSLSSVVFANQTKPTFESVLTPGSRLVAGDLSKNEFFILDKENEAEFKAVAHEQQAKYINKTPTPHLVKTAHLASHSSKKVMAAKIRKVMVTTRVAQQVKKHPIVPKIKMALHRVTKGRPFSHHQKQSLAMALKKTMHHKNLAQQVRIKKTLSKMASRNKLTKINLALHKAIHHKHLMASKSHLAAVLKHTHYRTAMKKKTSKIRLSLNHTHQRTPVKPIMVVL